MAFEAQPTRTAHLAQPAVHVLGDTNFPTNRYQKTSATEPEIVTGSTANGKRGATVFIHSCCVRTV